MDYTLVIQYADGNAAVRPCATIQDVSNWVAATIQAQFAPPTPRVIVNFQVINNTVL